MTDCFIGEVRIMSFGFAPKGWAACDGAILQISQNQPLFALFGTAYGGDGRTTFGLPNLRDRVAVHNDQQSFSMGQVGGEQAHVLTMQEMPAQSTHSHPVLGSPATASTPLPNKAVLATANLNMYTAPNPPQSIHPQTIGTTGGAAHDNMSPYLGLNFCVALTGIFPTRN